MWNLSFFYSTLAKSVFLDSRVKGGRKHATGKIENINMAKGEAKLVSAPGQSATVSIGRVRVHV